MQIREVHNRLLWWVLMRVGNTNTTLTFAFGVVQIVKIFGRQYVKGEEFYK